MTNQEVQSHTKKLVSRLLGQDAAVDDETVEKLKGFLKSRLSAGDHAQVCDMLEGSSAAAQGEARMGADDERQQAADAQADFHRRYPGLAAVRIDNSGIQPAARAASYLPGSAESFAKSFPALAKIKVLG